MPTNGAADFPVEDSLQFEYRYPLLPEGLLPRFIVHSYVHWATDVAQRRPVALEIEQRFGSGR